MSGRRLGILGLGCILLAFAQPSAAQSVTLNPIGPTHSDNGRANLLNTQLNHHDCVVDDVLSFPVTLDGYAGLTLEVWAGVGCDNVGVRKDIASKECWKLASFAPSSSSPPPISIPVRELISSYTRAGVDPSSASDQDSACQGPVDAVGPASLTVYFMLIDPASFAVKGTLATWRATLKLSAPPPPDRVSLGVGNEELIAAFSYDQISADVTSNGYQLYCEPKAGGTGDSDSGLLACAPSARLVAGASTDDLQDLLCGTTGKADTEGQIGGLTNNVPYNVAVAAIDIYDNVSVLSPVACEAPRATVPGHTESGQEQTSKACSFALGRPSFPLLPSVALGLCLLRRRRRRPQQT
jgi:hypothetical protein